jgi:hypothetical protein
MPPTDRISHHYSHLTGCRRHYLPYLRICRNTGSTRCNGEKHQKAKPAERQGRPNLSHPPRRLALQIKQVQKEMAQKAKIKSENPVRALWAEDQTLSSSGPADTKQQTRGDLAHANDFFFGFFGTSHPPKKGGGVGWGRAARQGKRDKYG